MPVVGVCIYASSKYAYMYSIVDSLRDCPFSLVFSKIIPALFYQIFMSSDINSIAGICYYQHSWENCLFYKQVMIDTQMFQGLR